MMNKQFIRLPFEGMYHSFFDSEVDFYIEQQNEYSGYDSDLLIKHYDSNKCLQGIAKIYCSELNAWFKDETDIDLHLEFCYTTSPKYYNFETDQIIAKASESALMDLMAYDFTHLNLTIKNHLASRDGFMSFYSDFVRDWKTKPLNTWDMHECSMLLFNVTDKDCDFYLSIFERCQEKIYIAIESAFDWPAIEGELSEAKP